MSEESKPDRRRFLAAAAMAAAALPLGANGCAARRATGAAARLPDEGELPPLGGATAWLNSQPLSAASLRGKVALLQFCTYTCINWLRTLPHVRAWAGKYGAQGLAVVGLHTPEFPFEKDVDNVRRALKDMGVSYPVAVDNDYEVWRAFNNRYWPALYFVDARGHVRHHHFGEGEYERSERVIQQLLAEAGVTGVGQELVSVEGSGVEAAADWGSLKSPENYVGYERAENFASPGGAVEDERRIYTAPERLGLNGWALAGNWTVGRVAAVLNQPGGRIACSFHARDLHLVMGPAARATPVRFRVALDGQAPGAARGADIDERGGGTLTGQRLYQLIRQPGTVAERRFEIEFLDAGAEAFAFTFG